METDNIASSSAGDLTNKWVLQSILAQAAGACSRAPILSCGACCRARLADARGSRWCSSLLFDSGQHGRWNQSKKVLSMLIRWCTWCWRRSTSRRSPRRSRTSTSHAIRCPILCCRENGKKENIYEEQLRILKMGVRIGAVANSVSMQKTVTWLQYIQNKRQTRCREDIVDKHAMTCFREKRGAR